MPYNVQFFFVDTSSHPSLGFNYTMFHDRMQVFRHQRGAFLICVRHIDGILILQ